jgi:hypothetical protein
MILVKIGLLHKKKKMILLSSLHKTIFCKGRGWGLGGGGLGDGVSLGPVPISSPSDNELPFLCVIFGMIRAFALVK